MTSVATRGTGLQRSRLPLRGGGGRRTVSEAAGSRNTCKANHFISAPAHAC